MTGITVTAKETTATGGMQEKSYDVLIDQSKYTVTVGNYAETCDLTGAGEITGWDASAMPM